MLIKNRANINAMIKDGFFSACIHGHLDILKLLIDNTANINTKGRTLMVIHDFMKLVKLVIFILLIYY
jgi:ankyrin repeat protein